MRECLNETMQEYFNVRMFNLITSQLPNTSIDQRPLAKEFQKQLHENTRMNECKNNKNICTFRANIPMHEKAKALKPSFQKSSIDQGPSAKDP